MTDKTNPSLEAYRIIFKAYAPMQNVAVLDAANEEDAKALFTKIYGDQLKDLEFVKVYPDSQVKQPEADPLEELLDNMPTKKDMN